MQTAVNGIAILDELLSLFLLINPIAILVVAFFLAWALGSLMNSHRRIADSLERLVRELNPTVGKTDSEKEWVIEEPSSRVVENSVEASLNKPKWERASLKPSGSKSRVSLQAPPDLTGTS